MTITNSLRLKRLKELHNLMINHDKILKTVKFDICTWGDQKQKELLALKTVKRVKENIVKCTSAACALGSACLYEPFQRAGLKFKVSDTNDYGASGIYVGYPTFQGETETEAGREFFGLSDDEANWLFDPSYYSAPDGGSASFSDDYKVTAKSVAARIALLIEQYTKYPDEEMFGDNGNYNISDKYFAGLGVELKRKRKSA